MFSFDLIILAPLLLLHIQALEKLTLQLGSNLCSPFFRLSFKLIGLTASMISGISLFLIAVNQTYALQVDIGPPPDMDSLGVNTIAGLLSLLVSILLLIMLVKFFLKPIHDLKALLMQGMDGDLRVRSGLHSLDELGQFTFAAGRFFESLDYGLGRINSTSDTMKKSKEDLSLTINKVSKAIKTIVGRTAV